MKTSILNVTNDPELNSKDFKINKVMMLYGHILLLYSLYVFFNYNYALTGDESRYIGFANNLLNGFYSSPYPNIKLWNGPGYPLLLAPILWLGLGKTFIVVLNVLFFFSSVILLHFCVLGVTKSVKSAYIFGNAWGFYYSSYQEMPRVVTEPFTVFILILLAFFYLKASYRNNKYYYSLSGLILGYLILTKVIFFYVVFILACLTLIGYIFSNYKYKVNYLLFVMAGIILIPYLLYTYNITGKFLYFSNAGYNSLYWMSNPNKNEFGDWNNNKFTINCYNESRNPCNAHLFELNHGEFFKNISELDPLSKDKEFRKKAFSNIVNHPTKFIRNYIQNISRLLFNFPNSYYYQQETTFYRIVPNTIVLPLFILVLGLIFFKHKIFDRSIRDIFCFVIVYLLISSFLTAQIRQFYIILPLLFLVFAYSLNRFFTIRHD